MGEFRMPSLGADMVEGAVLEWRVAVGDPVRAGQVLALIQTDKADIEAEVFESGVLEQVLVDLGVTVPVGTPLALIGAGAAVVVKAPVPAVVAKAPAAPAPVAPAAAAAAAAARPGRAASGPPGPPEPRVLSPMVRHLAGERHVDATRLRGSGPGGAITRADVERATSPAGGRRRVSPRARRLAAEAGVDLAAVEGSGPAGSVVGDDVARAAAARPAPAPALSPAPAPTSAPSLSPALAPTPATPAGADDRRAARRRAIGALMARSKREVPHYYLRLDVELSGPLGWLADHNADRPPSERALPAALLLAAVARAAATVPGFNGTFTDGGFHPAEHVDLAVAVSLRGGGLVAPAIAAADTLGLDGLMAALRGLVARARSGALRAGEMAGGTLTVTNLGDQGVDEVYPIIYAPQVAMVGFGKVRERPWAEAGMVGARPVLTVTLAADHRVTDGLDGARFLATVDRAIHEPEKL